MVDVGKDVIQVHNGIGMEVEILLLTVVNMLQVVVRLEANGTNDLCKILAMLNVRMMVGVQNQNFHILMVFLMILNLMKNELKKDANCDPKGILQNSEAKIEELNDHGMDLMGPKKAPKKIINLIL